MPPVPIHLLPPWCRSFCSSKTLAQRLHDLLPAAEFVDLGLLFVGEIERRDRPQPFVGNIGLDRLAHQVEALEDVAKHLIEAIEVPLVFDECQPRQIIEILDLAVGAPGLHGLEQRQILLHGDRQLGGTQFGEKLCQHGAIVETGAPAEKGRAAPEAR